MSTDTDKAVDKAETSAPPIVPPASAAAATSSGSPLFVGILVGVLVGLVAGVVAGQRSDLRALLAFFEPEQVQREAATSAPEGAPAPDAAETPLVAPAPVAPALEPTLPKRPDQQAAWLATIEAALQATDQLVALSSPPEVAAPVSAGQGFWEGLFQLRKTTQTPDAFYRAEFYAVTREQVRLRLLSARLSIQVLDFQIAAGDLSVARDLMVRFFDPQSAPLADMLARLEAVEAELRRVP
ncbi:MAG TPA: hypothetical protein VLA31_04640 [Burkholderiaceae bacterium]|nr:hypothetical protein [Burkholderiaceae bacterium]